MNVNVDYTELRNHLFVCMEQIGCLPKFVNNSDLQSTENTLNALHEQLFVVADSLKIDVINVIHIKILLNCKKYPAQLCYGLVDSYKKYSASTGVSTGSDQSIFDVKDTDPRLLDKKNDTSKFRKQSHSLSEFALDFTFYRGWCDKDTPRNLLFALHSEFAELCQIFQWKPESGVLASVSKEDWDDAAKEIADVFIYSLKLIRAINDPRIYASNVTQQQKSAPC